MGVRQLKLADEIRDILGHAFLADRISDPRLSGVTITHVRITKDLQFATVYFRLFDQDALTEALKAFEICKGYLKRAIHEQVKLRRIPDLRFVYDESIDYGTKVENLLKQT